MIDRGCIKRCHEQILDRLRGIEEVSTTKTSMYRERCRTSIEQTESSKIWLDGLGYVLRGIKKNPKNFDRRSLCWELSSSYRANRDMVFIGGKNTWDECKQDRHQVKHQKIMLSTQNTSKTLDAKQS